jgi:hypothetical protein
MHAMRTQGPYSVAIIAQHGLRGNYEQVGFRP